MREVTLDSPVISVHKNRQLFAIVNEKGLFLKKNRPYWTSDLNSCLPEIRSEATQIQHIKFLIKERNEYLKGKSRLNEELFLGFERLFIQEVQLVTKEN